MESREENISVSQTFSKYIMINKGGTAGRTLHKQSRKQVSVSAGSDEFPVMTMTAPLATARIVLLTSELQSNKHPVDLLWRAPPSLTLPELA